MGPWPRLSQSLEGPLSIRDPEAREPLDRAATSRGLFLTFLWQGESVPRLSQSLPDPLRCHVNSAVWGLGPASPPSKLGQRRANCWEKTAAPPERFSLTLLWK